MSSKGFAYQNVVSLADTPRYLGNMIQSDLTHDGVAYAPKTAPVLAIAVNCSARHRALRNTTAVALATATTQAPAVRQHGGGRTRRALLTQQPSGRPTRSTGGGMNSRCAATSIIAPASRPCGAYAYPLTGVRRATHLAASLRSTPRPPAQLVKGDKRYQVRRLQLMVRKTESLRCEHISWHPGRTDVPQLHLRFVHCDLSCALYVRHSVTHILKVAYEPDQPIFGPVQLKTIHQFKEFLPKLEDHHRLGVRKASGIAQSTEQIIHGHAPSLNRPQLQLALCRGNSHQQKAELTGKIEDSAALSGIGSQALILALNAKTGFFTPGMFALTLSLTIRQPPCCEYRYNATNRLYPSRSGLTVLHGQHDHPRRHEQGNNTRNGSVRLKPHQSLLTHSVFPLLRHGRLKANWCAAVEYQYWEADV